MIVFDFLNVPHMLIFKGDKTVTLFEMETGMFVYKFDFADSKTDGGITQTEGYSTSAGPGYVTNCKHWKKEAKDKQGENMNPDRRKDMFATARMP